MTVVVVMAVIAVMSMTIRVVVLTINKEARLDLVIFLELIALAFFDDRIGQTVALKGKGFPRSKNPGLRDNYLEALHREGRQAVPAESALKTDSSGLRKEDIVSISTVRPARYPRWSKDVSYARALIGKA
jgi:hypothetical protein